METFSLTCQNCGAPLTVAKTAREAICNHCGTKVGIKPSKDDPDLIILDADSADKPPIRPQKVRPALPRSPDDPADQRRQEQEADQVRLVRHGANLLDAFFGFRGCLHMSVVLVILGSFLMCGLCGLPAWLRWNPQGRNGQPANTIQAREHRTDDMLRTAARAIEMQVRADGKLPSTERGNAIIDRYHDEWGGGLRYEKNSATNFVIRSGGPDTVLETPDDKTKSEHSTYVRDSNQNAAPPADVAGALEQLQTPGLFQKDAALNWLVTEKPELDANQRSAVVEAAIPLLKGLTQRSLAQSVLTLWAEPSDAPKLLRAAEQAQPHEDDYVDTLVIQLIRLQDESAVLPLLNHSSNSVRASIAIALRDWHVSDEQIALQSIQDLERQGRQAAAIIRLQSMQLAQDQLEEVASKAKQLIMEGETMRLRGLAYDFLLTNGQLDTPLLIKVYESQNNAFVREPELGERSGQALTERPEPAVFLLFASQLGNRDRRIAERGVTYLKIMGPAAESYVWPSLRSDDRQQRERATLLLAAIGTAKSIPHLERLVEDDATGSQAQAAILDIQNANRQPVNVPTTAPDAAAAP